MVIDGIEQGVRSGKETIENTAVRIEDSLNISHATILVNLQIGNMTLRAADLIKYFPPPLRLLILFIDCWLEIVEQIKLHEVDEAQGNFIGNSIVIRIVCFVVRRWRFEFILVAIEHHPGPRSNALAVVCPHQFRIY